MALAVHRARSVRWVRWRQLAAKMSADVLARARASSRVMRARAGFGAGVATSAWGVGVVFGVGWALMVGGAVTAVSFLLLYPVDDAP